GAVATQEADIIPQWQQLVLDRGDQSGMVAAWQIGASDGTTKQHVANMGESGSAIVKYDKSGPMTEAMQDFEIMGAERYCLALGKKAVRHAISNRVGQAEAPPLVLQICEQRSVGFVRTQNFNAKGFL